MLVNYDEAGTAFERAVIIYVEAFKGYESAIAIYDDARKTGSSNTVAHDPLNHTNKARRNTNSEFFFVLFLVVPFRVISWTGCYDTKLHEACVVS